MSISKPRIESPCVKFCEFKGDKGTLVYFDKTIGEKGEQVEIKLPIYFIVLDELNTIKGYCKKANSGFYSNEVKDLGEILHVRTFKGGIEFVGKYKDIADRIKSLGGKFTKSVYALMLVKKGVTELVNFSFKGVAFSSWLDKKFNAEKFGVKFDDKFIEGKSGATTYLAPIFKPFDLSKYPDLLKEAVRLDTEVLQPYLKAYKTQTIERDEALIEKVNAQAKEDSTYPHAEPDYENDIPPEDHQDDPPEGYEEIAAEMNDEDDDSGLPF